MVNKRINQLTELTTASGTDMLMVYDLNESGSVKTKKIQVSNIGSYGGGALQFVTEITASAEVLNESVDWDGETYPICIIIGHIAAVDGQNIETGIRFNGDSGSNYNRAQVYQDNVTVLAARNTTDTSAAIFHRASTGASVISANATLFLRNIGTNSRSYTSNMFHWSADNNDRYTDHGAGFWTNNVDDVTSLTITSVGEVTGYIRLYRL